MAPATLYAASSLPKPSSAWSSSLPAEAGARYGRGPCSGCFSSRAGGPETPGAGRRPRVARRLEEGYRHDWGTETSSPSLGQGPTHHGGGQCGRSRIGDRRPRGPLFISGEPAGTTASSRTAGMVHTPPWRGSPCWSCALPPVWASRMREAPAAAGTLHAAPSLSLWPSCPANGLILSSNGDMSSSTAVAGQSCWRWAPPWPGRRCTAELPLPQALF